MVYSHFFRGLTGGAAFILLACNKETVTCGHGFTIGRLSYEVVDGQGLDWLARPGALPLDSLRRLTTANYVRVDRPAQRVRIGGFQLNEAGVSDAGGDQRYVQYLRLSRTDTVEVVAHFGALTDSKCQRYHSLNGLEVRYNGRSAGSCSGYVADRYAADWGKVVTVRKAP